MASSLLIGAVMKTSLLVLGACMFSMGLAGCAAESNGEASASADSDLVKTFGADDAIRCTSASDNKTFAIVHTKDGKAALLTLTPAKDVFALSRTSGKLTGLTFAGSDVTLTVASGFKTGTWESGAKSADLTCEKVDTTEAASWRTANALADYGDEIDGIASAVLEESNDPTPKPYTVFAIATADRSSLSLGTVVKNSNGSLTSSSADDDEGLYDAEWSYGAMSAAYALGGGDDYGEWFQGVSDGVSLTGDIGPALGSAKAGYIAHEKVTALSSLVDGKDPSAVEITVGPWTFFLPDCFPKQ